MKRNMIAWPLVILTIAAVILFLFPVAGALAQGQGSSGGGGSSGGSGGGSSGGGNGNRPPGGEESTTNLSYPANFFGSSLQSGTIGVYDLGAQFPDGMSYGCAVPEMIGTTTYPNTSCVNEEGTPQDAATCQGEGGKCAGRDIERIYWQKNADNKWQAGYALSTDAAGASVPLSAEFIDWGDNLEGKSWPVGGLRVETNTFSTLPELPDPYVEEENSRVRFDIWHVRGQGTDELWGVHATNPQSGSSNDPTAPYIYQDEAGYANWPYAVNVSPGARLNIAKLQAGGAACPSAATGMTQSPFKDSSNLLWNFDQSTKTGHWVDAAYTNDILYGAELNIKGSYVYGYNWRLDREVVPAEVSKTGWWRLTFYTPDNSIIFDNWVAPTAEVNTLAPPLDALTTPSVSTEVTAAAEEGGDSGGLLYVPQVDKTNQLTYLDICITPGSGGGGGGSGSHGSSGGGGGVTGTVTPQGVANGIGGGVGKGVGGGRTGGVGQGRGGGRDLH